MLWRGPFRERGFSFVARTTIIMIRRFPNFLYATFLQCLRKKKTLPIAWQSPGFSAFFMAGKIRPVPFIVAFLFFLLPFYVSYGKVSSLDVGRAFLQERRRRRRRTIQRKHLTELMQKSPPSPLQKSERGGGKESGQIRLFSAPVVGCGRHSVYPPVWISDHLHSSGMEERRRRRGLTLASALASLVSLSLSPHFTCMSRKLL